MELIKFLESFKSVTNIPVCIYSNNEYTYILEKDKTICLGLNKIYSYVLNQKDYLIWIEGLLIFYKCEYNHQTIIMGPCITYLPTDKTILSSLLTSKMFLTNDETKEIINRKINNRVINYIYFKNCINMLTLPLLNKEFKEINEFSNQDISNTEENDVENLEIQWSNHNLEYVHTMEYYVQNGMVDELNELFKIEKAAPYGSLASNELRHYKNSMMVHIYIIRKAASLGGVDEDLCIRLSEAYAQQCESATTIQELTEISQRLRLDFCKRVNKLQMMSCNNITIMKAIRFIHEHRMDKLNANIISSALNISPIYLCSEFKKEMGISIVDFIHKEKLKTAKKMLLFTNYSLSEISAYLAFSSQSYFQSIFKKYENMTPNEFKRRNQI